MKSTSALFILAAVLTGLFAAVAYGMETPLPPPPMFADTLSVAEDGATVWACPGEPVPLKDGQRHEMRLEIRRFYGSREQLERQKRLGLIDEHATLYMAFFGCERRAELKSRWNRFRVSVNGYAVGEADGHQDKWSIAAFKVPLAVLNLPLRPGESGVNYLRVTAQCGGEALPAGIGWAALVLEAPANIWLAPDYGAGGVPEEMSVVASILENQLGLVCRTMMTSPEDTELFRMELAQLRKEAGAPGTVFASGGSGVLCRRLLEEEASDCIKSLLQAGAPNGGSPLAELRMAAAAGRRWTALTPDYAASFNRRFHAPRRPISWAGSVLDGEALTEFDRLVMRFLQVDSWDGESASAESGIGESSVLLSPGSNWDGGREGLLLPGAPQLLAAFSGELAAPVSSGLYGRSGAGVFLGGYGAWGDMETPAQLAANREMVSFTADCNGACAAEFPVCGGGSFMLLIAGLPPAARCRVIAPSGREIRVPCPENTARYPDLRGGEFDGEPGVWSVYCEGMQPGSSAVLAVAEDEAPVLEAWAEYDAVGGLKVCAFGSFNGEIAAGDGMKMTFVCRRSGEKSEFLLKSEADEDGIFTAWVSGAVPGGYLCRVEMECAVNGMIFRRSRTLAAAVPLNSGGLELSGDCAVTAAGIDVPLRMSGLPPGRCSLQGDVMDENGQPLVHAALYLESSGGDVDAMLHFSGGRLREMGVTGGVTAGNFALSWLPKGEDDAFPVAHLPAGIDLELGKLTPFAPAGCEFTALQSAVCIPSQSSPGKAGFLEAELLLELPRNFSGVGTVQAALYEPSGWMAALSEPVLIQSDDVPGSCAVRLRFAGGFIGESDVAGEWRIGGVVLADGEDGGRIWTARGEMPLQNLVPREFAVMPQHAGEFGNAVRPHGLDCNGDLRVDGDEKRIAWERWCRGEIGTGVLLEALAADEEGGGTLPEE